MSEFRISIDYVDSIYLTCEAFRTGFCSTLPRSEAMTSSAEAMLATGGCSRVSVHASRSPWSQDKNLGAADRGVNDFAVVYTKFGEGAAPSSCWKWYQYTANYCRNYREIWLTPPAAALDGKVKIKCWITVAKNGSLVPQLSITAAAMTKFCGGKVLNCFLCFTSSSPPRYLFTDSFSGLKNVHIFFPTRLSIDKIY